MWCALGIVVGIVSTLALVFIVGALMATPPTMPPIRQPED